MELFELALTYVAVCLVVLVSYSTLIRLLQRKGGPEAGHGLFAVGTWPRMLQLSLPFIITVHFILPCILFIFGFLAAAIVAPVEGWDYSDTFEYIMCNIAALPPMVHMVPANAVGQITDIVVTVTIFTLTAVILGIAASMGMIIDLSNRIPDTTSGICACLLAVVFCILLLTVLLGAIFSALESWDMWTGFLFMISIVCGIGDPLTSRHPVTEKANFFALLCSVVELSIGGAIVGLIGAHPKVVALIALLETNVAQEDDQKQISSASKLSSPNSKQSKCDKDQHGIGIAIIPCPSEDSQMTMEMHVQEIARLKAQIRVLQAELQLTMSSRPPHTV